MKKLLLGMLAIVAMIATSCQQEVDLGVGSVGETATVSINVGTPTRSYSDGTTATVLQYAVYDANGNELTDLTKSLANEKAETINGSTIVKLQLVTGNKYSVIFWAAAPNAPYSVDFANKTMTVTDYTTTAVSNDENRDAFYKYHTFTVQGAQTETIELKRPFAQLNIGTDDYVAAAKAGYVPTQSTVTVKNIYKELNLWDGTVDVSQPVTFATADIKKNNVTETFPVAGYDYLAMNYLLVSADQENIEVEFTCTDGTTEKKRTVGSVPVQRNHRTNLYGSLLTSDVTVNVEIVPEYETPDNLVYVWDGSEVSEPQVSAENSNIYVIEVASELAWLAGAVNGTLDDEHTRSVAARDFAGKTFRLTKDVDLGGKEWTPIGSTGKIFKGTFDGQGHVVKNLVITGNKGNVGLFGVTHDGEIKNLVVENAKVSGRTNVGVVAGQPYTSKYTNIIVRGHVEVNGLAYVGGVGGKNAYANWTNITVNVDEASYVNANSVENGTAYRTYVGGVIGFIGEGGHTFKNISSNIKVIGSTCDIGGITGIAHYNNTFVNCFSSGDVTQTSYEGDNLEIGGIAGVWHNENNTTVTLDKCVYTGTLKVNGYTGSLDEYVLTGSKYSTSGTGTLNIISYTKASNETEIRNALSTKENVELTSDVKATAQAGGYNKTGLVINGQYFDGNGYELNVKDAGSTWDSAIYTTGGTIRNLTVSGAMRGIFTAGQNSDIIIDNVTFKDVIYTFNSDDGNKQYSVYISNSTLNGWTSYSNVHKEVSFTNCSFGEGSGYAFLRPYNASSFANCTFSEGYELDSTKATKGTLVMTNCYVGNTKITQANITELLGSSASNVIVK